MASTSPTSPKVVDWTETFQAEQANLRSQWENHINNPVEPVRYDKTVALLLSWDLCCDELDTNDEVTRLYNCFKEQYNFEVYRERLHLDKKRRPDLQIHKHLINFVDAHVDEKTLMIVYYAGHGWGENSGAFRMSGKVSTTAQLSPDFDKETLDWTKAETCFAMTHNDTLVILDCCHAGFLDVRGEHRRCCEYLVACGKNVKAQGPGKHSFTSALIIALETLAKRGTFFSTQHLLQTIKECEDLPKSQVPLLFPKFGESLCGEHIVINPGVEPLTTAAYRDDHRKPDDFIDLRFQFLRTDEDTLEHLAKSLAHVLKPMKNDLDVQRIVLLRKDKITGKAARLLLGLRKSSAGSTAPPSNNTKSLPLSNFGDGGPPDLHLDVTPAVLEQYGDVQSLTFKRESQVDGASSHYELQSSHHVTTPPPSNPTLSRLTTPAHPSTPHDRVLEEGPATNLTMSPEESRPKRRPSDDNSTNSSRRRSKRLSTGR